MAAWPDNCISFPMIRLFSFGLVSGIAILLSCSAPERSTGREVKKETSDKRKAALLLSAEQEHSFFNLREGNFFEYYGAMPTGADYYAGIYDRKGDSLFFSFHNNYQPQDLTGKGFIDKVQKKVLLFSKNAGQTRSLTIIGGQ
jgi:hypothetical protein